MEETTRALYLGTQRIILVLLHDFPDFLSQAFFALCDAIPPQCIQLHNLILSAFPVNTSLRLMDPLQSGLKIELLPEINKAPQVLSDTTSALSTADLRAPLDKFLQTRTPVTFPALLKERLLAPASTDSSDPRFNIPLINSMVMYLGESHGIINGGVILIRTFLQVWLHSTKVSRRPGPLPLPKNRLPHYCCSN